MKIVIKIEGSNSSLELWGGYAYAFIIIVGGGTCYMIATVIDFAMRFIP